eukprot:153104_1
MDNNGNDQGDTQDNDDKSLNHDFDEDMYDQKDGKGDDADEDENADDADDADDDKDAKYPDSLRHFKDAEYNRQDQKELQRLNAQDPQQNNNPYNMMNPLAQLQSMAGLQQRRRLGVMDRDASLGIGAMFSGYNQDVNDYLDDDYYEDGDYYDGEYYDDDYYDDEYYDDDYYDDDDGYYYDEDAIDAQEEQIDSINEAFVNTLRQEFDDMILNFNHDGMWDSITHVHDPDKKKWIRKCTSLQTAELCATTDPAHKTLRTNVKIGKYKFHRSYRPWEQKEADAIEDLTDILEDNSDNDKRSMKNMDKMQNIQQQHMDTDAMQDMSAMDAWGIDSDVIDVDDDEWNNNDLWTNVEHIASTATKSHKPIVRKCRGLTLCLCQYLDKKFDGEQKHKCVSYKDHKRLQPNYKLLNVMDEFMSRPLRHVMMGHHNQMNMRVQYHPSIVHLHIMGRHPFFHRKRHLHRYKIPWFRYRRYQHLRPNKRPHWCPRWIWREVNGHLKKPKGFEHNKASEKGKAARLDETNYYEYDGDMTDRMDEMNDEDSFEEELPFLAPLIRASLELLPNVYNNARKVLPSVVRQRLTANGDIGKALNDRQPEFLGHAGPELRNDLIRSQSDLRRYNKRYGARMDVDDEDYEYNDDYIYDDDEDAYDFEGDDYDDDDEYYGGEGLYGVGNGMTGMKMRNMYPWQRNIAAGNGFSNGMSGMNGFNSYQSPFNSPSNGLIQAFQNARMRKIAGMRDFFRRTHPQTYPHQSIMRRRMRYDDGYYYDDEEEENEAEEDDIVDNWYDEDTGMNWVVLRDDFDENMIELDGLNEEDMAWELVKENIISASGKRMNQRCMNLFGRKVCICQFLAFIKASRASHLCYPSNPPNVMKQEEQKEERLDKELDRLHKKLKTQKVKANMRAKQTLAKELSAEPVKPGGLNLINGKPLGPKMIRKIKRVNDEKKKTLEKKKEAQLEAKETLQKAQTNILKAKAHQIRQEVKGQVPPHRPLWLPHYFWHWLHHAPHFHLLRHKRRVSWQPQGQGHPVQAKGAQARVDEEDVMNANVEEYDWLNDDYDDDADEEYDYDQSVQFESDNYAAEEDYDWLNAGYDDDADEDYEEEYDWSDDEQSVQFESENYAAEEEYDWLNAGYDDDADEDYEEESDWTDDEQSVQFESENYAAEEEYDWLNAGYDDDADEDYEEESDWTDDEQSVQFESDDYADEYGTYTAHDLGMDNEDGYGEHYDWIDEEEFGDVGYESDEYDDDNEYDVEDESADMNYLQSGNDFTTIDGDAGEYGGGFLWMIGLVSFMLFCICAFFMSIGIRRRRRELRRKKAQNIYMQQALEMTDSESESGFDQDIIE